MKSEKVKRKYFTTIVLISFISLICVYNLQNKFNYFHEKFVSINSFTNYRKGCQIPIHLNPFDDTIKEYMQQFPENIECKLSKESTQDITFIDYIDGIAYLKMRPNNDKIQCFYQLFSKSKSSDDTITYKTTKILDPMNGIQMNETLFANVSCFENNKEFYKNFHWISPKVVNKSKVNNTIHPSVLILVIESLSRLNYLRYMHKTQRSFESLGHVSYLKGLTKLGDNSFPNMVPFLTGKISHKNNSNYL